MKNFMIGQYGNFDYQKFNRDFKEGFYGIEACLFETEKDIQNLIEESKKNQFEIGIHFPLRPDKTKLRDPLFLSNDAKSRHEAFQYIQDELEFLSKIKPTYILFHYPKPVILDDRVDWSKWRFGDKQEYVYESTYSFEEFREHSEYLFKWLSKKSEKYHFTPVLEFDGVNKYVYETEFLEELLKKYSTVKLCLDTGRLHLQNKIDPNFSAEKIIKKYAKYTEIIHLWNVKVNEALENNHYPALPQLNPKEGWAPIEEYMRLIKEEKPNVKIMFEHQSNLINEKELNQCYEWIDSLLK